MALDVRAIGPGDWTYVSVRSVAPAANAVQADTGALAAGVYDFVIDLTISDTVAVGKTLEVQHRNAANGANIQVLAGASPNGGAIQKIFTRYRLAASERIRVVVGAVAGAASSVYISAIGRRIIPL